MNRLQPSPSIRSRLAKGIALGRALTLAFGVLSAQAAFATTGNYFGMGLVAWSQTHVFAPMALISCLVAVAAAVFRPDFIKGAVYAMVLGSVGYFIAANAQDVMSQVQQ